MYGGQFLCRKGRERALKVCFVAGREPGYQRNRVLIRTLRAAGIELREVTSEAAHYAQRFPAVFWRLLRHGGFDPDLYFVGFLGHPIVPLLGALSDKPIVFDPFISIYDTLCNDRQRFRTDSLAGRLCFQMDRWACEAADMVLLDTNAHIEYFASAFSQPRDKFHRIWVGADDRLYFPRLEREKGEHGTIEVFYYATFQPLHGVDVVLKAAELLESRGDIRFRLVGKGPELKNLRERLERGTKGGNLTWLQWVPEEELPEMIASADICLGGHFSSMPKAARVISGKTYQFLAMRKPVVVGDNPANQELLEDGENAVFVSMDDPGALAAAIVRLADDAQLRRSLAFNGYQTYRENCTPEAMAAELTLLLGGLLAGTDSPPARPGS
jgi:glycosyltransferase involved in cell wall biosynthesis